MKYDTPYKICDPVHGFIRFNELEKCLIDSLPFQRLRYLKQMGMAYLVYPGATHTRFEHSLGVMHLADKIFMTLFAEERAPLDLTYWRQILRLAALCHDLGHLPFSHTAESALLPKGGHEAMTRALIESESLSAIWQELGSRATQDIIKLAIDDHTMECAWEKLLAQIITEDNFGADRIDYLLRDAYATGAGYGIFDALQLIDSLKIAYEPAPTIGVQMSGLQSVESLWVARYMMVSRVSHHPKVRLYSQHMVRVMKRYYEKVGFPQTLEAYLEQFDDTVMGGVRAFAKEEDYDAQVVLLQKKPFQQIIWPGELDEPSLFQTFSSQILIDHLIQKKGHRHFPVVVEGDKVVSSELVSPFLANIPPGAKGPYLFAHPDRRTQVIGYLEARAGCSGIDQPVSQYQES